MDAPTRPAGYATAPVQERTLLITLSALAAFAEVPGAYAIPTGPHNGQTEAPYVSLLPTAATLHQAVTSDGVGPASVGERAEIPFGCDGVPTPAFPVTATPAEDGAVWLLPDGEIAAKPLPLTPILHASDRYTVTFGAARAELQVKGRKGKLSLWQGDQRVYRTKFERYVMEGADDHAYDLKSALGLQDIAVPSPVAAFEIAGQPVLITRQSGYEGVGYSVFAGPELQPVPALSTSLYLCAF